MGQTFSNKKMANEVVEAFKSEHKSNESHFKKNDIFVGNLSLYTTDQRLGDYFSRSSGEVESVRIQRDRFTGRSRRFGFISFKNESSVENALKSISHWVDGMQLDVKRAFKRSTEGGLPYKRKNQRDFF